MEKRRFTRIPFKVRAELTVDNVAYIVEEVNNLSVGGCLLPLTLDSEPGQNCRIRIQLSGVSSGLSIKINGKIARLDKSAIAIQFTHIDMDSLFHLKNLVRYNAPDPDAVENEIMEHPNLNA